MLNLIFTVPKKNLIFFFKQKENIINKKRKIQRLRDVGPDPGKPKKEYNKIKQPKWIYSNLSQQKFTNHRRNPANPRTGAKPGYKKRMKSEPLHRTVRV